ncbi:hypothetical protein GCM10029964_015470 [Kibdelosporangium lantanae]
MLLLDPLLSHLSASLVDYNRQARLPERIRLRFALHAGEVEHDSHGLSGSDVIVACRLLDADQLKGALRHSTVPLAAIVSDAIYDGIVRHRYRDIDPAGYHPVNVQVKKARLHAWIHLPGTDEAPSSNTPPRPRTPHGSYGPTSPPSSTAAVSCAASTRPAGAGGSWCS